VELWMGLISGVLLAVLTGIVTSITTSRRLREEQKNAISDALRNQQLARDRALEELQLGYDRALRDIRLEHYQRLYHVSRCIPREWKTDEEPTRPKLSEFREQFHNGYFGEDAGGLFLTAKAREHYFCLQNELERQAMARPAPGDCEPLQLTPEESKSLRSLASTLRHQLVEDVGTAEPPRLQWVRVGDTPAPPSRFEPPSHENQRAH
jgi:hypothetical protein